MSKFKFQLFVYPSPAVIYVLAVMGVTSLAVIVTVLVLLLHHTQIPTPPPAYLTKLAWALNRRAMEHAQTMAAVQDASMEKQLISGWWKLFQKNCICL